MNYINLFETAKKQMQSRNFKTALKNFNICLKSQDFKTLALFEKAKIYFELGNDKQALKAINNFVKYANDKNLLYHAFMFKAKILKHQHNTLQALQTLDSIPKNLTANNTDFAFERLSLSIINFERKFALDKFLGRTEELEREFKTIKNFPLNKPEEFYFMARVSNYLGQYAYTKKLLANNPVLKTSNIFYRNALKAELEIASKIVSVKTKPRSIWVCLGSRCNLNCVMCQTKKFNWDLDDITLDKIFKTVPYLEKLSWQGGEPTIYKNFENYLLKAAKINPHLRQTIATNGQYMPDSLLNIIANNNIELNISVDSADKAGYESIRRGASFKKLTDTLNKLKSLNKPDIVKINFVLMKNTQNEINKILKFAKGYDIHTVNFIPVGICDDMKLSKTELKVAQHKLNKVRGVHINNLLNFTDKQNLTFKTNKLCHAPWYELSLNYNKNIYPNDSCAFFMPPVANIEKVNFVKSYNSAEMQKLRKYMLQQKACHQNCERFRCKIN